MKIRASLSFCLVSLFVLHAPMASLQAQEEDQGKKLDEWFSLMLVFF